MREVTEQEGRVDERRGTAEGRHMRGADDGVIHRAAGRHVFEELLFQPQRAVFVHDEVDRPVVVLLHQFLEPRHCAVEDVFVIELAGAVQGDWGLGLHHIRGGQSSGNAAEKRTTFHEPVPSSVRVIARRRSCQAAPAQGPRGPSGDAAGQA
jgi:hypothetical protein